MLSFLRKKNKFFTAEEVQPVVDAIRQAEKQTSGEIRVFVESRCSYMNALDRAAEIFFKLQMQKTQERNAVLIYVAMKDRQLAIFGDEGIHQKLGEEYWTLCVKNMITHFNEQNFAEGIRHTVQEIGEDLRKYFPFQPNMDKNELPDDIVFGR